MGRVLLLDAALGVAAVTCRHLLEVGVILGTRAVEFLLEDGLSIDRLELGLEVLHVVGSHAVGTATRVRHRVVVVLEFVTLTSPRIDSQLLGIGV